MTFNEALVRKICKKLRKRLLKHSNDEDNRDNLAGYCGLASFCLSKIFHEIGLNPKLMVRDCDFDCHCWVELEGKIIDITMTQFGYYPNVYIRSKKHNEIHAKGKQKSFHNFNYWRSWDELGPRKRIVDKLIKNILPI